MLHAKCNIDRNIHNILNHCGRSHRMGSIIFIIGNQRDFRFSRVAINHHIMSSGHCWRWFCLWWQPCWCWRWRIFRHGSSTNVPQCWNHLDKFCLKSGVVSSIQNGVITGRAHGQNVANKKEEIKVLPAINGQVQVTQEVNSVEW